MIRIAIGFVLSFVIGAGCRYRAESCLGSPQMRPRGRSQKQNLGLRPS